MFTLIYLANHLVAVETSENYVERFVVVVSNDGEIKFVCKSISWYFEQKVMFDCYPIDKVSQKFTVIQIV